MARVFPSLVNKYPKPPPRSASPSRRLSPKCLRSRSRPLPVLRIPVNGSGSFIECLLGARECRAVIYDATAGCGKLGIPVPDEGPANILRPDTNRWLRRRASFATFSPGLCTRDAPINYPEMLQRFFPTSGVRVTSMDISPIDAEDFPGAVDGDGANEATAHGSHGIPCLSRV